MTKSIYDINEGRGILLPKRLYDHFSAILTINRLIGYFPVSVKRQNRFYVLKFSWIKLIIGYIILVSYTTLAVTGLISTYEIEAVYETRLGKTESKVVTLGEILMLFLTYLVGHVFTWRAFDYFWEYLLCLKKVDEVAGCPKHTRKIIIMIVIVLLFTVCCLGADIYMWSIIAYNSGSTVLKIAREFVPYYYTFLFSMILELNFWIFVYQIYLRLNSLKATLTNYLKPLNYWQNNVHKILNVEVAKKKDDFLTPANVRKLIEIYDGIFDATVAVNRFYSITLPVSVLNCIICLIITPFVLYQQLISVNVEKFVYTQSFWMTCHVLRLLLMIEPCHYCKEEEKDIRRLVLKLMNVGFGKEVQTQMKLLWINLFENNIDIGPGHFATLSRGLIPTISASATTYLIVLFQSRSSK